MTDSGLTSMVARYRMTKDACLINPILDLVCRLTATVVPRGGPSPDDLEQTINLKFVARVRQKGLPNQSANSEDFRKLLGRMAINARRDVHRRDRRWEKAVFYFADLFPEAERRRLETRDVHETLNEIRSVLTEEKLVRVFDLLREGLATREIAAKLGRGFSEPNIYVIRSRIRDEALRWARQLD